MFLRYLLAATFAFALTLPVHARTIEDGLFDGPGPRGVTVDLQADRTVLGAADDVTIAVTFTNNGRSPVSLAQWFVPGEDFDEPVFEVLHGGAAVPYLGPIVKRAAPEASDFVWLQPGESITVPVELSGTYDFSAGGSYQIRYRAASAQLFGDAQGVESLASTPIGLEVAARAFSNVRMLAGDGYKAAGGGGVSYTGRCSATQQADLLSAVSAASNMSGNALGYLQTTTPSSTPRYTTWFGAFTSTNWNTAKSHYLAIKDAFDTKPLTLDCGCKKSYYAYVYPNQPYKIYVCKAFWAAPMTGTDSKGGTLVHEMSHFNVTAGTNDWAYGQTAAKSLAASDPTKALNNADNHEYFAENTPSQN